MPQPWQQFVLAVLFLVVVPLGALGLDLLLTGEIPDHDLYLTCSVYIFATGTLSREPALFGVSIVVAAVYFVLYGVAAGIPDACPHVALSNAFEAHFKPYLLPAVFTIFVLIERHKRHVKESEPFWALR